MWGGLILAAKCGEKNLIVLMNFSLKLAAKLQNKNIPFELEEHPVDSARENTHTHYHMLQCRSTLSKNKLTSKARYQQHEQPNRHSEDEKSTLKHSDFKNQDQKPYWISNTKFKTNNLRQRKPNILQSMPPRNWKSHSDIKNKNHETYRFNPVQEQPLYTKESNVFQTYANFTLPWESLNRNCIAET